MKKLLLFDIDGTLISVQRAASRRMLRRVVEEVFELTLPEEFVFHLGGKTDFQIMHETAERLGISRHESEQRRTHFYNKLVEHTTPLSNRIEMRILDGVEQLIAALRQHSERITLGLLTGNIKPTAYLKLRPYHLDGVFGFGAFGCDHIDRAMLPPVAIRRANEHIGINAFASHNTVIIGDTLNDIRCAKAHSIPVIAVASGHDTFEALTQAGADTVVENFADVDAMMRLLA